MKDHADLSSEVIRFLRCGEGSGWFHAFLYSPSPQKGDFFTGNRQGLRILF